MSRDMHDGATHVNVSRADSTGSDSDPELANDPYKLSSKLKAPEELEELKNRTKSNTSRRRLKKFYEAQNESINRLLTPVDEHIRQARQVADDDSLRVKIAQQGSFAANLILAGLQIYGASTSLSLSLFATMADAIFDPFSNLSLIFWNWRMNKVDGKKYPSGNSRIESVGNIIFCWIMTAVSAVLITVSVIEIVNGVNAMKAGTLKQEPLHLASIIAVACAFGVKLLLFLYCWPLKNRYTQIQILWVDHRNDLLINGFGIFTATAGNKLVWWIDPAGAIILSVIVICLWSYQAGDEFKSLVGLTAEPAMLQWITYLAATHSSYVTAVDTVRAYHSGPRIIVEVDIVLDPELPHRVVHDIAEELQFKLESLPNVERAYVHSDYETTHKPEHFLKKVL